MIQNDSGSPSLGSLLDSRVHKEGIVPHKTQTDDYRLWDNFMIANVGCKHVVSVNNEEIEMDENQIVALMRKNNLPIPYHFELSEYSNTSTIDISVLGFFFFIVFFMANIAL